MKRISFGGPERVFELFFLKIAAEIFEVKANAVLKLVERNVRKAPVFEAEKTFAAVDRAGNRRR